MTFLPWLDLIFYTLGAILLVRGNYLAFRVWQRVSRHHPDDPRFDYLWLRNHWSLVVQRDRELYPHVPEERQRREIRFWTILAFPLFAAWVARQIIALKLR